MDVPFKIYLDQNHLSRMAEGLLGKYSYKFEKEVYEKIIDLVEKSQAIVYYSWCHVYEGMRYKGTRLDFVDAYCSVVEKLTRGNCIVFPTIIQNRELEIFICKKFDISPSIDLRRYPYGINMEVALERQEVTMDFDPFAKMQVEFHQALEKIPMQQEIKENLRTLFSNKNNVRKLLLQIPQNDIEDMKRRMQMLMPGAGEVIKNNQDFVNFMLGSKEDQDELARKFHEEIFTFRNLVSYYKTHPKLIALSTLFDKDSKHIADLIVSVQQIGPVWQEIVINEDKLRESITEKFIRGIDAELEKICQKHNVDFSKAKDFILKSGATEIKILNLQIALIVEYCIRHKGEKGREPGENDLMDLNHAYNLPYVDVFVAERFSGEVLKRIAKKSKINIFNNLRDFSLFIEKLNN